MIAWLRRNAVPILFVVAAAALVTGIFEVIDAAIVSSQAGSANPGLESGDEAISAVAGLIKVALFLTVSVGVTIAVRRRMSRSSIVGD